MARRSLSIWMKGLALAAIIVMSAGAAHAQYRICADHAALVAHLAEQFQERQYAVGLIGNLGLMEIFVAKSGSWTIAITNITGRACIIAGGNNWEIVRLPGVEA